MQYFRMFADENGDSHVEAMENTYELQDYAPPAPAFGISPAQGAERYVFVQFPPNWTSELHPAPKRQLCVILSGEFQGETSDGIVMDLKAGDMVLMEDTSGLGHKAKVIGDAEVLAMMIHLD
ncbi:MAG: hypothetical protein JKY31_12685 [Rhodobacteraceae bacterium]|nr:hypothetical protein [Paracoccaceae bacterium]